MRRKFISAPCRARSLIHRVPGLISANRTTAVQKNVMNPHTRIVQNDNSNRHNTTSDSKERAGGNVVPVRYIE